MKKLEEEKAVHWFVRTSRSQRLTRAASEPFVEQPEDDCEGFDGIWPPV